MRVSLSEQGDTLVEIVIALSILTLVLVSSFVLSNRSFRLGQQAKDRTQAAELLQQQAEALRGMRDDTVRDSNTDFSDFCADIRTANDPFLIGWQGSSWRVVDQNIDTSPNTPNSGVFKLYVEDDGTDCANDEVQVLITVTWLPLGGGQVEQTSMQLRLLDIIR